MSLTFFFNCIKPLTASLRYVQDITLLELLWKLRYRVGYSEAGTS